MFLIENLVTIYLKTENIFIVNQIIKKIFEIFLIQIHFKRSSSANSLLRGTHHQIQQAQTPEQLLAIFRNLEVTFNIDQKIQLISLGESEAFGVDVGSSSSDVALTFEMKNFSKQLESFNIFLASQIQPSLAKLHPLIQFLMFVNSLLTSAFFLSRSSKQVLLNQTISFLSFFRSEVYSDRISHEFHMNSMYIELLYLTLLNFVRVDHAIFTELPKFQMDQFIREALEVFFHTENLMFRRLFAKALIKQLWHNLAQILASASSPDRPILPPTTSKLFRCCLLVCKFNFMSVNNDNLDLKEDIQAEIESLLGTKGILHIRQVLSNIYNASIDLSFDSETTDFDFEYSDDSR